VALAEVFGEVLQTPGRRSNGVPTGGHFVETGRRATRRWAAFGDVLLVRDRGAFFSRHEPDGPALARATDRRGGRPRGQPAEGGTRPPQCGSVQRSQSPTPPHNPASPSPLFPQSTHTPPSPPPLNPQLSPTPPPRAHYLLCDLFHPPPVHPPTTSHSFGFPQSLLTLTDPHPRLSDYWVSFPSPSPPTDLTFARQLAHLTPQLGYPSH
jgi:hypothetical protein